jgi:hypothetical protein
MTATKRTDLARSATPFFEDYPTLSAVVDGVLRGHLGTIAADDDARPRAARMSVGCYEIFGGDPPAAS